MRLKQQGPPITPEDIHVLERGIEHRIPPDYREFLLKNNGGVPERPFFRDGDQTNRIMTFFPLRSIYEEFDDPKLRSRPYLLPIALDIGNQEICLALDTGQVQLFTTESEVKSLAESFSVFIEGLFDVPETLDEVQALARSATAGQLPDLLSQGSFVHRKSKRGLTLLSEAIACGNDEFVFALLRTEVDLSGALHVAMRNRRWEMIPILLKAGADVNEVDDSGKRPLDLVYGVFGLEREKIISLLRAKGARDLGDAE